MKAVRRATSYALSLVCCIAGAALSQSRGRSDADAHYTRMADSLVKALLLSEGGIAVGGNVYAYFTERHLQNALTLIDAYVAPFLVDCLTDTQPSRSRIGGVGRKDIVMSNGHVCGEEMHQINFFGRQNAPPTDTLLKRIIREEGCLVPETGSCGTWYGAPAEHLSRAQRMWRRYINEASARGLLKRTPPDFSATGCYTIHIQPDSGSKGIQAGDFLVSLDTLPLIGIVRAKRIGSSEPLALGEAGTWRPYGHGGAQVSFEDRRRDIAFGQVWASPDSMSGRYNERLYDWSRPKPALDGPIYDSYQSAGSFRVERAPGQCQQTLTVPRAPRRGPGARRA